MTGRIRKNAISALLIATLAVFAAAAMPASADERGDDVYKLCVYCHGADGGGNESLGAPSIAGQELWYLEKQLRAFRSGERGTHFTDLEGMRMRPMAMTLRQDEDLVAVAKKVAAMPPVPPAPTLDGDATRGQASYALCATCHGPDATGIVPASDAAPQGGPALIHLNDWYMLRQIQKFQQRVRAPGYPLGLQMNAMSMTVPTEQAMKDVIAYIGTLRKPSGN